MSGCVGSREAIVGREGFLLVSEQSEGVCRGKRWDIYVEKRREKNGVSTRRAYGIT